MSTPAPDPASRGRISVVTPAFNEAANLAIFYERLVDALARSPADWEWLLVDDHSADGTYATACTLAASDPRVRPIRLAANVGAHAAIGCGFDAARGEAAVVFAADLQDPPDLLPRMISAWLEGAKVVWGSRLKRASQNPLRYAATRLHTGIVRAFAGPGFPADGADCVLVGTEALTALKRVRERRVPVFALIASLGLPYQVIVYDRAPRLRGQSGWTLEKKVGLVTDSITALTDRPIRWAIIAAVGIAVAGFAYAAVVTAHYFVGQPLQGWSSLMVVFLVLSGLQLLMLGILGSYVWRILEEVRRTPRYEVEARAEPARPDERVRE
jgi:polyisoprenyl-phosphate glycosyltransferase